MKMIEHDAYTHNVPLASKIKTSLIALALTTFCCGPAVADDSEVFFGQVDRSKITQPNLMFVLDTSDSMKRPAADPRINRLKVAMSSILNQSDNVNIGIMRMSGWEGGGAVLYPITSISDRICLSDYCGNVTVGSQIDSSLDDIEEEHAKNTVLTNTQLNLGDKVFQTDNHMVGLRFNNVDVPQGATITSATLEFYANANSSDIPAGTPVANLPHLWVRPFKEENAPPFNADQGTASSRDLLETHVWYPDSQPDVAGTQGWEIDNSYESTNFAKVLQPLVDEDDWCGGNSMGFLLGGTGDWSVYSFEGDAARAPTLKITYDSNSIEEDDGCAKKLLVSRVFGKHNDAEEKAGKYTDRYSPDLELLTEGGQAQRVGLRFTDVLLPRNAEIIDARLVFTMDNEASFGDVTGKIYGEDADNPGEFKYAYQNIGGRDKTDAVPWTIFETNPPNGEWITPNVKPIVEEIIDRDGWRPGNAMVFILENAGGTGLRDAQSYDRSAATAPKLVIQYIEYAGEDAEEESYITARELLRQQVNGMRPVGNTPIVDVLYEAGLYFRGKPVDYGKTRGSVSGGSVHADNRVSHPLSYTGGTVYQPVDWCDRDSNNRSCKDEEIKGDPVYISPMESECQTNHIVLVTDGEAKSNSAAGKVKSLTNVASCKDHENYHQECGYELVDWYLKTDHHATLPKTQNITTHTIGFDLQSDYVKNLSVKGGGRYYEASSATELLDTFKNIISDVYSVDTSFVAPGATVNQFNRLTHRNDIYFALFKPESRPTWDGNLKKYEIGIDSNDEVTIFDYNTPRVNAVDPDEGFFSDAAKSGWSTVVDGSTVAKGGAAEQHRLFTKDGTAEQQRQLYTYLGDMTSIPAGGVEIRAARNLLHENNAEITDAHLGTSSTETQIDGITATRDNILKWTRGVDVKDGNDNNDVDEMRLHMGDPMHSRPVIMNYANPSTDADAKPLTTVFVGTNEGILHGINSEDGREIFAYMPKSLLLNIKANFENSTATRHQHGLDGPMTTWTVDRNNNVMVDGDEEAMLFLGMRRGGSNYYAFDVSDRENPKIQWVIQGGVGGTPGFERLGQSWSRMVPTKLRIKGVNRNVLIFGGGYDLSNDIDYTAGMQPKLPDAVGNSIFIVSAETGELLYSLNKPGQGTGQGFAAMDYAIPSDIRVLDIDGNGFADSMFVGDMGGQVWRFDFNLYHEAGDGNLLRGGVLADFGTPRNSLADTRRFFYEPDVALNRENGSRFLSISLGSGWRSHPLNTIVQDQFFMIRSYDIYNMPAGYGKQDINGNWVPIVESDLTEVVSDPNATFSQYGWRLDFSQSGEKVLGDAITVSGNVVFTTYLPETSVISCSAAIGGGAVYALRVVDGRPSLDLNEDGTLNASDHSTMLNHGGVPPEATALIVEGNDGTIKPTILVGPEQPLDGLFNANLTKRSFWIDTGMTTGGARAASIDVPGTAAANPNVPPPDTTTDQPPQTTDQPPPRQ